MRLLILFLSFLSFNALAADSEVEARRAALENARDKVKDTVAIPMFKMIAIETTDGEMTYVSPSGRYIFKGHLIDTWSGKFLDSTEAIRASLTKIDLKAMGVDYDRLSPLVLGKGEDKSKDVVVFTDPTCEACLASIKEMQSLSSEYTFKIFNVPVLGGEAFKIANRLFCSNAAEALKAVISKNYEHLATEKDCDINSFREMLFFADTLGIDRVPTFIAPDSRVSRGKPESIKLWLSKTES